MFSRLVKPVSEDLTSVFEENVTACADIFREIFKVFVERLVACCIYRSGCKAAYVPTVTSPHRLQSRHCLLTARDQIWRTLRTGQVTQLALSRWNSARSSVRERSFNGVFFPPPLLVQSSAASRHKACVWKWHSNSVTTAPKTELALLCFVCEHLSSAQVL